MFQEEITILGYISLGVLVSTHRGYLLVNSNDFKENVRGFYVLEPLNKAAFRVKKFIPLEIS